MPNFRSLAAICVSLSIAIVASVLPAGQDDELLRKKPTRAEKRKAPIEIAGNLLINGSFERRKHGEPNKHIESLVPGNDLLSGWEIVDTESTTDDPRGKSDDRAVATLNVDWIGPTRWIASHGKHCLDIDGGIRQTVRTINGASYLVRFDMAGNPETVKLVQHLRVDIDDRQHEFAFNTKGKSTRAMGWVTRYVLFAANRNRTSLQFVNKKPNAHSAGVALDNVILRRIDPSNAAKIRALLGLVKRFQKEAAGLQSADRHVEARQHAAAAERYRRQLEALLGHTATSNRTNGELPLDPSSPGKATATDRKATTAAGRVDLGSKRLKIETYPQDNAKPGLFAFGPYPVRDLPNAKMLYSGRSSKTPAINILRIVEFIGRMPGAYDPGLKAFEVERFERVGSDIVRIIRRVDVERDAAGPPRAVYVRATLPLLPPGEYTVTVVSVM